MKRSCNGCVAPKRHPGCQSHCPDYIIDDAFHQVEKAEQDRKRAIEYGLMSQRGRAVSRAIHAQRSKGGGYPKKVIK